MNGLFPVIIYCLTLIFPHCISEENRKSVSARNEKPFTEGILYTRVSFPGNVLNPVLEKIDFERDDVTDQLKALKSENMSKELSAKIAAQMNSMSPEERKGMSAMMMASMLSPLFAKICYSQKGVLARASAVGYSMESFMGMDGAGKMVAVANDQSSSAAIRFSAPAMREVWEKDEVGPRNYTVAFPAAQDIVAGYMCNKAVYTYKANAQKKPGMKSPPYKVIVWFTSQVDKAVNFMHPFYFQLNRGILKAEVHYDKEAKNRMVYEVTRIEQKALTEQDFRMADIEPVLDWDTQQAEASMAMLSVLMSGNGTN